MASTSAKGASRRERHGFVEVIYDPLAVERDPHAPLIVFNPDELPTNAGSPCPDEANDGGDVRDAVDDGELDSGDDDSVGSLVDFIAPDDAIEDEEDEDGATGEFDVCPTEDDDDDDEDGEDDEDEDEEDDDEAEPPASKPDGPGQRAL